MSTLKFETTVFPAQRLNGESTLPPANEMSGGPYVPSTDLDEDDDFWAGYGQVLSPFPYRMQNMYTRELHDTEFLTPVLENEYLRAVFVPDYGGKLWSLVDKTTGRELFMANPVVRPCNLAIRNAWTSGGVEWNCGFLGHHPYTCSRLFTARASLDDGTPVLRMYEYERVRQVVYQMDFFLPDGSKMLFARMRIVNDRPFVTPIYWWSNIAVPELKGARVIAPVTQTYTPIDGKITKTDVPRPKNFDTDITYPVNLGHSVDFFWKIPAEKRKYICQLDRDGYGLVQTSTARLKGRKLFVWGQGPGGDRWQQYLTSDDGDGRYAEIQAGLAQSQYESIAMPPRSAWEWMEAYGAMQADPAAVHGDWEGAKAEVEVRLERIIDGDALEKLLIATRPMAKAPAQEQICQGSGWAALENYRRSKAGENTLCPQLDFGALTGEQLQWKALLDNGTFGEHDPLKAPESWMLSDMWTPLVKKAAEHGDRFNWYTQLQYGMILFSNAQFAEAEQTLERSYALRPSPWALYGIANCARIKGDNEKCALLTLQAANMCLEDASLAKEAVRTLSGIGRWQLLLDFTSALSPEISSIPRVKMSVATALLKTGRLDEAEDLLYEGGGILVPDVREGEVSVTELWYSIEEAKAKRDGREFDRAAAKPPAMFDFRMNAEK